MLQLTGDQKFDRLSLFAIVLLLVVYSTHLFYLPVDPREDEVRRALVTLEMMIHGDLITPTLYGLPYLNKPPLYNWLLLLSFKVFGVNEIGLRLPVLLALFAFGYMIYRYGKKYLQPKTAVIASLFFLTNGRILIYDSLLGLIDIFYSSLVFLGFMLGYQYSRKHNWTAFFISTYIITTLGYMMKGLPSIVFQGILFFAIAVIDRNIRFLFNKRHVAGILIFAGSLGAYYAIFFARNGVSEGKLFGRLVTESTMRTFLNSPWQDFAKHIFTYPFLFIYHYAPWAIYIVLLIRPALIPTLKQNSFIWFSTILFIPSFLMYYASPYVIPRYLFMILPLLFMVLAWLYEEQPLSRFNIKQWINTLLIAILLLIGTACFVLPFLSVSEPVDYRIPKAFAIGAALIVTGWFALRIKQYQVLYIIIGVIIMRMGFNWFVIAQRGGYQREQIAQMEKVMAIADNTGQRLFLESGAELGNADNMAYLYALRKNQILFEATAADSSGLFITDSIHKEQKSGRVLYHWSGTYQPDLYLVDYKRPGK